MVTVEEIRANAKKIQEQFELNLALSEVKSEIDSTNYGKRIEFNLAIEANDPDTDALTKVVKKMLDDNKDNPTLVAHKLSDTFRIPLITAVQIVKRFAGLPRTGTAKFGFKRKEDDDTPNPFMPPMPQPDTATFTTQEDDRVCDECDQFDGEVYDENDVTAPDIPLHPNCRCYWDNTIEESTGKKIKIFRQEKRKKEFNPNHDDQGRFASNDLMQNGVVSKDDADQIIKKLGPKFNDAIEKTMVTGKEHGFYIDKNFNRIGDTAKGTSGHINVGYARPLDAIGYFHTHPDADNNEFSQHLSAKDLRNASKLDLRFNVLGYQKNGENIIKISNYPKGQSDEIDKFDAFQNTLRDPKVMKRDDYDQIRTNGLKMIHDMGNKLTAHHVYVVGKKKEFNPNHDPDNGQFTSGDTLGTKVTKPNPLGKVISPQFTMPSEPRDLNTILKQHLQNIHDIHAKFTQPKVGQPTDGWDINYDNYMKKMVDKNGPNQGKDGLYIKDKIELSDTPTERQKAIGEKVAKLWPGKQSADYYAEQARKVDFIRAKAEDVGIQQMDWLKNRYGTQDVDYGGRIKETKSAVEKMARKGYSGTDDLRDVIGLRVVTAGGIDSARKIAEDIRDSGRFKILKYEDVLEVPKAEMGLRGVNIDIEDEKTGLGTELQIKTERQEAWNDAFHDTVFKAAQTNSAAFEAMKKDPGVFEHYTRKISDYYHALDSGHPEVPKPECPPQVRDTIGCVEL